MGLISVITKISQKRAPSIFLSWLCHTLYIGHFMNDLLIFGIKSSHMLFLGVSCCLYQNSIFNNPNTDRDSTRHQRQNKRKTNKKGKKGPNSLVSIYCIFPFTTLQLLFSIMNFSYFSNLYTNLEILNCYSFHILKLIFTQIYYLIRDKHIQASIQEKVFYTLNLVL